jgi:kynurenine formamidase
MFVKHPSITMLALALALPAAAVGQAHPDALQPVSRGEFDAWFEQVKNWGRWGADDSLGTLNLITPAVRRAAAALVRAGVTVSLARDIVSDSSLNDPTPMQLVIGSSPDGGDVTWNGERFTLAYHGWTNSHFDWLPHTAYRGIQYGGRPGSNVQPHGAPHLGVENANGGIVTRGVLVDAARLKGVDYLEPGTAITAADLETWERQHHIRVGAGDVILLRTGRWARERAVGTWRTLGAGFHPGVALWLHQRGVAAIGSDVVNDVMPSPVEGLFNPLHQLALVGMGMPLFDNLDLEAVTRETESLRRWTFLFVAAPLRLHGGTGSPMNPLAVF